MSGVINVRWTDRKDFTFDEKVLADQMTRRITRVFLARPEHGEALVFELVRIDANGVYLYREVT
jgi:hypothetical protein